MTTKDDRKVSFYRVRAKYDPDYYSYFIKQTDLYKAHIDDLRDLSINRPTYLEMQKLIEKYDLAAKILHDDYNKKIN